MVIAIIIAQVKATSDIEPEKIKALRRLFTSTSLSTALLSFLSTMGGLRLYIFQDNFVSAFVLSGAVQGALFAISTEFFKILGKFSRIVSKIAFIIIWLLLLLFSSGFSYVGISKTAYPDGVLKEDAEQILIQYCLDTDYELLDYTKKLEKEYLKHIYDYLNILNGEGGGFVVSEQDKLILEGEKADLQKYQNTSEIDNGDGTKTNASEIKAILNTQMLCTYIDTIKKGNYGNNLIAYKKELNNKITEAKNKKDEYDQRYDSENQLIVGNPNADTEAGRLGYNGRSAQYRELSDPNYLKLQQDITIAETNKKTFKALSDQLNDFINYLEECKRFIKNDFETGAENDIYNNTRLLKEEVNKENINIEVIIEISEKIYNKLIENNTSAEDEKITEYATFKNNLSEYKIVIQQKESLEKQIDDLNDYSNELLLGTTADSPNDSTDSDDKKSNSDENSALKNFIHRSQSEGKQTNSDSDKIWKVTWSDHLLKIQSVLKKLPNEYSTTSNGSIATKMGNTSKADNVISLPKKKTKYLEEISDRRRLYLTDINDFDRAWTLFFASFHPSKYKLMLFVSVIIAFGLDLISFAMGCLLSKIKV